MPKKKNRYSLDTLRHSLSHIMALALQRIYGKVLFGIGPTTEDGFYYDVAVEKSGIPLEDLPKIEKEMQKIIKEGLDFKKQVVSLKEAKNIFKKLGQKYKLELLKDLEKYGTTDPNVIARSPERSRRTTKQSKRLPASAKASLAMTSPKTVAIYQTGEFIDLCRGPHVKNTKDLPLSFKLTKVSGAYWRGDEKNPMLQRITGLAFNTEKELKNYLYQIEEAEKRDHRKLGRELELYIFDETAPGMAYWLPKGLIIYNTLLNFWRREHAKRGYQEIRSPLLNKKILYEISGHWDHYRENMFISETEEGEIYCLKPMNCPNAMIVFKMHPRSYKELPLRLSDCDTLHRFEKSGTLNGLLRVREFSQDDAHIFITEDQIGSEYKNLFDLVKKFYSIFKLNYSYCLSTRPKDFMGDIKTWNRAEKTLINLLKNSGKTYTIDKGGGVFYGPKIDIHMKDSLGRNWQMGTLQLDFQLPRNFNLKYIDNDGKERTPVTIHRVIYGSLERFIGILVEHYAGAFPLWLAPVQVVVLPVLEKNIKYAHKIKQELENNGFRVELNSKGETLSKRIREAEMQKIPYILVIGDKEEKNKGIAVRKRGKGDLGAMKLEKFLGMIQKENCHCEAEGRGNPKEIASLRSQ